MSGKIPGFLPFRGKNPLKNYYFILCPVCQQKMAFAVRFFPIFSLSPAHMDTLRQGKQKKPPTRDGFSTLTSQTVRNFKTRCALSQQQLGELHIHRSRFTAKGLSLGIEAILSLTADQSE